MKEKTLKEYLKEKQIELNETIIQKLCEKKEDPTVELRQLDIVTEVINICESRNRY